jgi:sporulation protein YlmC with PRC-barrel domain
MEIIHTIKMVTYIIAKQLGGKPVITVSGEELGRLDDVVFDEGSGQFISIVVEPVENTLMRVAYPKDGEGNFIIPYDAVNAVGKVVVVKD